MIPRRLIDYILEYQKQVGVWPERILMTDDEANTLLLNMGNDRRLKIDKGQLFFVWGNALIRIEITGEV